MYDPSPRRPRALAASRAALLATLLTLLLPGAAALADEATEKAESQSESQSQSESESESEAARFADEIVVSAHRAEMPAPAVGSSVTVLDRDDIERRHVPTVLELLRTVPGLEVVQTGGPGQVASVFIRGGNSSHTLVLLDGMRLNDNTVGAFDFSQLSVDQIERVEVVRGPQSALYGSEAVAGVVSLFSRRGSGDPTFEVAAELGEEEHARAQASVRGGSGALDYAFDVGWLETRGLTVASEGAGNPEEDPWRNTTLAGHVGYRFSGDGRLDVDVRYVDGDAAIDGFGLDGPADDNGRQLREQWVGRVSVEKDLGPHWRQTVAVGTARDELQGVDPDSPFSNFQIDSYSTELLAQSDVRLGDSNLLSFGVQVEEREAVNEGSFDRSLDLYSFFVQDAWSFEDRLHVTVGARYDDHETFGGETTARAALAFEATSSTRLRASWGTGFKAPTFNELYFPGFGNPGLEAETSRGFDFGVEQTLAGGRVQLEATYFDQRYDDLILFAFPAGFVNVAEAEATGVELAFHWQPVEGLDLRATYTLTDSVDLSTGEQLARRPEDRYTLDVRLALGERVESALTAVAVEDRVDSGGAPMDDYVRLDLAVDVEVEGALRPYLRVRNLLDEDYEEVPGYDSPGRLANVGLRLRF